MSILDSYQPINTERSESPSQLSLGGLLKFDQNPFKFTNDNFGSSALLDGFPKLELTDVGRATASIGEIGAVAKPANALSFLEGDKRDGGQGSFELTLNPVLPPARLLNRFENVISGGDGIPSIPTPWSDEQLSGVLPRPYVPISGPLTGSFLDSTFGTGDPVGFPNPSWEDALRIPLPRTFDPTGQLSGSRAPEENVIDGRGYVFRVPNESTTPGEQPQRPGDQPQRPGDQPQRPGDGQDKPKDPIDKVLDSLSKEDLAALVKQMLKEQAVKDLQAEQQQEQQKPQNMIENLLQMLRKMFDQPTIVRVPKNRPGGGGDTNRPEEPQPEQPGEQPEQPPEQPRISPEQLTAAMQAFKYFENNKERLKNFANGTPPTDQEMRELVKNLDAVKALGWENQLPSVGVDQKYLEALVTVFGKGTDTSSSDTVVPARLDTPSNPSAPSPVFA